MFDWFRKKPRERGEFDDIFEGIERLLREGIRLHVTSTGGFRVDRRDYAKYVALGLKKQSE